MFQGLGWLGFRVEGRLVSSGRITSSNAPRESLRSGFGCWGFTVHSLRVQGLGWLVSVLCEVDDAGTKVVGPESSTLPNLHYFQELDERTSWAELSRPVPQEASEVPLQPHVHITCRIQFQRSMHPRRVRHKIARRARARARWHHFKRFNLLNVAWFKMLPRSTLVRNIRQTTGAGGGWTGGGPSR